MESRQIVQKKKENKKKLWISHKGNMWGVDVANTNKKTKTAAYKQTSEPLKNKNFFVRVCLFVEQYLLIDSRLCSDT